jgi:hypothetical protein
MVGRPPLPVPRIPRARPGRRARHQGGRPAHPGLSRPRTILNYTTYRVRCRTLDRRCLPAAPTLPEAQARPRNRTPRQCRLDVRDGGQVLAGRPIRRGHGRSPRAGQGRGGRGGRPFMHAPPATAVDDNRRIRCPQRQDNLDAGGCPGCPPPGVPPQPGRHRGSVGGVSGTATAWRWCPDGWCPLGHRGPAGGVRAATELDAARCPLSAGASGTAAGVHCGQPGLQEAVAGPASTGGVPPPPGGAGELAWSRSPSWPRT